MKVRAVYARNLITAEPRETLARAAERMVEQEVGALTVFHGETFEGIITERDLVRAIAEGADPWTAQVDEHMTPDPAMISPDAELSEAAAMMLKLEARHLPVGEGRAVVGMLSARDILVDEIWPGEGSQAN
ncbi:MAG: hypothetical protein KatS3mg013_0710 [Actinomycetota bacterium]|nr:MAG: hypothetical protein KatS3mg013_0710 [Actinomycetota bacterium]